MNKEDLFGEDDSDSSEEEDEHHHDDPGKGQSGSSKNGESSTNLNADQDGNEYGRKRKRPSAASSSSEDDEEDQHQHRRIKAEIDDDDDSDEDDDEPSSSSTKRNGQGSSSIRAGLSLTGFLFGNIDTKTGKLEDNVFDNTNVETEHLWGLQKLGYAERILEEKLADSVNSSASKSKKREKEDSDDSTDYDSDSDENEAEAEKIAKSLLEAARRASIDDYDHEKKSPSAEDFFDIDETIHDDEAVVALNSSSNLSMTVDDTNYDDEDEPEKNSSGAAGGDKDDQQKMPPPSLPARRAIKSKPPQLADLSIPQQDGSSKNDDHSTTQERKLETPLAAMLPSKYAGVSVTTLFPDFRPDKVLRFARLFGPGKSTSLPQLWKNVKKRRKKRAIMDYEAEQKRATENLDKLAWELPEERDVKPVIKIEVIPAPDEEEIYLRGPDTDDKEESVEVKKKERGGFEPKMSSYPPSLWRNGPANLWFEMLGVPEDATSFDYGIREHWNLENEDSDSGCGHDSDDGSSSNNIKHFEDEAFHLGTQGDWESAIIWDSQDAKVKKINKNKTAGWVPSGMSRTAHSKTDPGSPSSKAGSLAFPTPPTPPSKKSKAHIDDQSQVDDTWYSIFPVETDELVNHRWEDEVIWDVEKITKIPEPKILALDPNDKNIILCMPDDIDPSMAQGKSAPVKVKIPHPHVKKSKILLGKAGVINVIEEDSPPPSPKKDDLDPYNISNDEYYAPRHTEQSLLKIIPSGNIIQHSTPVVELRSPFIPTHMGPMKLRNFHRPTLKKYANGPLANPGPHPVYALTKHIIKKAKQRENERLAAGGGDIFVMRTPEDISGKDGRLILIEYCEEHPPLLNQVGMCSKIKNYFKRHAEKNIAPPELKLGETTFAHTSPFLGVMHPGEMIQTIENNLYRAPIFEHPCGDIYFIAIRTRNNFSIREYDVIFTGGQLCPLYEVPGPNSKRANNFVRDFLQVFIYRLFWKSRDNPRRIRMDDIKRAFPMHSESSIRKRLKQCADFKRTGVDSNWWVIKPEFRLPTEEELRAMVSPEQCCAYASLVAAEQRLKDAGYGEKFLFAPQDDDDEENQGKIDDEVKTAPWNTTRAYIQAMKGKCILQLVGPADPTGVGEGFSYIRVPNKPQTTKEEQESQPKRIVMGTDADLRKLSLSNARNLLRKFLVPEEEIQKLSRWEVIDVVRTLSTEKAKQGEKGIIKFSRGNRFSVAEHQERYKEECQRIFELQNRILMTSDPLTSDEGESNDEEEIDDAIEEMGKNIENMLSNRKTTSQMVHEKEEQERLELQKMIMGDGKDEREGGSQGGRSKKKEKEDANTEENAKKLNKLASTPGRVLKIHRKFKSPDGKEFTRTETVRKSAVIDIYVRMRAMKDESFIRSFTLLDDQAKEEMKKEKRRIQEQLRRIKRNQEKEHYVRPPPMPKKRKIKMKPELKMKCGACGQKGHMRTNKACPYYEGGSTSPVPPMQVAMTEEQEEEIEKELISEEGEELVKLDGTKVHLSAKVFKHAEEIKRRSLLLKVPKDAMSRKRFKKKNAEAEHDDYLSGKARTTNRRRIDPRVMISNIFESILSDMRNEQDSNYFVAPVSQKTPKYYEVIKTPMDLQSMRDKIRQKKYESGSEFLSDAKLLVQNSITYNGEKHLVTAYATKIYALAEQKIKENASKLSRYEKLINPLLDDNYKRKMNYILSKMIEKVKMLPESASFLKPVNKKTFKNYYEVIENPMDLDTMEKKIRDGLYSSRYDFLHDLELIHLNAVQYNGAGTSIADKAAALGEFVKKSLTPFDATLTELEISIQKDDADKINESDSEYIGSDNDELSLAAIEADGNEFSPLKFSTQDSNDAQVRSVESRGYSDIDQKSQSKPSPMDELSSYSHQPSRLSLDESLDSQQDNTERKRVREDSAPDSWTSNEATNELLPAVPAKKLRTDYDSSTLDRESQQAIEAMIQLSKGTTSYQPRYAEDANIGVGVGGSTGGVGTHREFLNPSSSIVEDYVEQSIHADLEVSDSESEESSSDDD